MIQPIIRNLVPVLICVCMCMTLQAQSSSQPIPVKETEKPARPYRILTSGKQVTIKCTRDIKSLMVWTSGGNRVHEQKKVNASQYTFRITVPHKLFFIMIQLADGKTYSEKIGLVSGE